MNHNPRRNRSGALIAILAICAALLAPQVMALTSDREKPMNIQADSVAIDDQSGRSIYRGKVVVIQGTMRITADTLTLIYDKKQKLKKIIAEGKPTTYKQRPDNKKHDVVAIANKLVFFAKKEMLVLTNNAKVIQGGNQFKSKKIYYNMRKDQVRAGNAAGQKKGRVNIVLESPVKKKKKKKKRNR